MQPTAQWLDVNCGRLLPWVGRAGVGVLGFLRMQTLISTSRYSRPPGRHLYTYFLKAHTDEHLDTTARSAASDARHLPTSSLNTIWHAF